MRRQALIFAPLILASAIVWLAVRFLIADPAAPDALAIIHHPLTMTDLRNAAVEAATTTPARKKLRILIVPGHEPDAGGTASGRLKERDLNVQLAQVLQRLLDADGRYETILARDTRAWNPVIAAYFSEHWDEIDAWRKDARQEVAAEIASGSMTEPVVHIGHNDAAPDVAVRLYGLTKWADENGVDLMVHVHFDGERTARPPASRTGFAVFVPAPQYRNAATSRAIAEKLKARLAAFDPISDLPGEREGIVEDPQLIAVGEQDTSDPPSLLTEYAFIYEKRLQTAAVRNLAIGDMALQTALGLQDFFFGDATASPSTAVLPHAWKKTLRAGHADPADVYALQTALILDGDLPPPAHSMNACSRNGVFGPCTRAALKIFQKKEGVIGEDGFAGKKTLEALNARWPAG